MITKEYLQQELAKRIDGYKRGVETSTDNIIAEMKSILVLVDALSDYEKKYNEALARAKDVKNGLSPHDSSVATVEYIFPELRESEDERIRKAVVSLVYEMKGTYQSFAKVELDKMVAWLEKQKVHHIPWYDYQKSKEAGYTIVPNEEYEQLIKQKEQKPAEQLGGTFTSYDMAKTFTEGQNYVIAHPEKFGLCKPAEWSEEDERMLERAIHIIAEYSDIDEKESEIVQNWLNKSLRPQPKQEWSEEDERNRDRAIFYTRFYQRNEGTTKGSEECIDWLKSLRPSWKPSEEQMMKEAVDWDAFRREAAKDFMTAIIAREAPQYDLACRNVSIRVSEAIMWADELIKQLREENK